MPEKLDQSQALRSMLLATFWFSLMSMGVKYLEQTPTSHVVFARSAGGTLLALIFVRRLGLSLRTKKWGVLLGRSVFGSIAVACYFWSVQTVPLATAAVLQQLSPLFSVIVAIWTLGERPSPAQYFYMLVAFGGVVLVRGFDPSISTVSMLIGASGALASALAYSFIRQTRNDHHPLVVVFYFALVSTLSSLPFALWQFRVPGPGESLQLLGVAITTFLGQYYMTQAYQKDVVSRVAIIGYLGPALAVAYGFVLFHEIPTLGGLAGLALIVLSVSLSTRRAWGRKT